MASIVKLGERRYRAYWRNPEGVSRSKTFTRKVDAEDHLTSVNHRKRTGDYIDASAGKVTFEQYAREWEAAQVQVRPSTRARTEILLRRHIIPAWGERPLSSIKPTEVRAWVAKLTDEMAPATVAGVFHYFGAVMRAAVADRLIVSSPAAGVKLPKVERTLVVPLEVEHLEALTEAMPERWRAVVTVAAGTGLRQGELLGLTVDRIDFLRRQVRVDRQLLTLGASVDFGPCKTRASVRSVPLPAVVVEVLAGHLTAFPAGVDGLVFTDRHGEPMRRQRISELWRATAARAGVPSARFHDLRHFYASALIRAGCSVKVVQARLGHATAAETLDTYSHLWPDDEDRTRAAVDAILNHRSGSSDQSGPSCFTSVSR